MLRPKPPQNSFYGSYLYDRIVPHDHLLRKINAVVDFSFVNDLVKDRYRVDFGRPAEDPEFMLRLCLLQYIYGDSDRKVVENARVNLAYKYFLGLSVDEEVVDDTTLCTFRTQRLGEEKFRQIFRNVVQQCIDKGLVTGKHHIVDSTHIEADAARNSLAGILRICRRNVLLDVAGQNAKVAERLGLNKSDVTRQDRFTNWEKGLEREVEEAKTLLDGVVDELKEGSLKINDKLVRSLELLEKAVSDRGEGSRDRMVSPIDPDARLGKKDSRRWTGYKGHLMVEEDSEIITAIETTPANRADGNQLKTLLKQQEDAYSLRPEQLSADKAYDSGTNLELLDYKGITGNIGISKKANHIGPDLFTVDDFQYDTENDALTCPAGCTAVHQRRQVFRSRNQNKRGKVFLFHPDECNACQLKARCHIGHRGRAVYISHNHSLFQNMKERLSTEAGREAYQRRYKVERKIADLTRYCGMRRCRYRGLAKASIHTLLAAIASNVKRMAKVLWNSPVEPVPKPAPGC